MSQNQFRASTWTSVNRIQFRQLNGSSGIPYVIPYSDTDFRYPNPVPPIQIHFWNVISDCDQARSPEEMCENIT